MIPRLSKDAELAVSHSVLFVGKVQGQTPCVLCWFHRAFMFTMAVVLGHGFRWQDRAMGCLGIALISVSAIVFLKDTET